MRAETRGKSGRVVRVGRVERRRRPREKRRVLVRRKVRRETVRGGLLLGLLLGVGVGVVEGARRSDRVPVRSLAKVEVRATMETWVAGEFEWGMEAEGG